MPTASRTRRTSPAWTSSFSCIISAMRSSSPFYISVASVFVAIFCVSLSLGAASAAEEKPDHVGGGTQQDSHHTGRQPPNLLYILSDDMRSDLGYLGAPAVTPNLDALAKKSLVFTQAFTQLSVCAPSRMSFMSSLRPDTSKVWNFIDTTPADAPSLPGWLRGHGYQTYGLGKLWHQDDGAWNADRAWTSTSDGGLPYFPYQSGRCPHGGEGGGHCIQPDSEIYDWHLMNASVAAVQHAVEQQKKDGKPFMIGTGFRKPHAPWQAPQRMWDLYDSDKLATATVDTWPVSSPLIGWSRELNVVLANGTSFKYGPFSPVPQWVQQDQRHAYYASMSYVDENVGKILSALEESGVANNTVIAFHADHGYSLSEHGYWEKKSNSDIVVRVPFLLHVPWATPSDGKVTTSLTELVDIFPTLASVVGVPPPPGVDGVDVSALLADPTTSLKTAAYHQYPACRIKPASAFNTTRAECNNVKRSDFTDMGYSIRTADYRLTAWYEWDGQKLAPKWDGPFALELYNHTGDDGTQHSHSLDDFENENLADSTPDLAKQLHEQLLAFFKQH